MKKVFSVLLVILFCVFNTKAQTTTNEKEIEENVVFQKVEIESEFPGGNKEFIKFLQKKLNGNIPTQNNAKKGLYTVIVSFVVNKDGTLSKITPETNHGYGMENEVIRVLQKSPKWKPGLQQGKLVSSVKRQPVTFVVQ
jgi:periplasmic protein TonB